MKTAIFGTIFFVAMVAAVPSQLSQKGTLKDVIFRNEVSGIHQERAAPAIPRAPGTTEAEAVPEDSCTQFDIGICRDACGASEEEYNEPGMCSTGQVCCTDDGGASGDPHYMSLDGKRFSNQGKCSYVLLQDCLDANAPQWAIQVINEEGDFQGHPVTRVSGVKIRVRDEVVTFGPKDVVTVSGKVANGLLNSVNLGDDRMSLGNEDGKMEFHYNGHFTVSFDGVHHVKLEVSPELESKVCGLLGNNDGNPDNDLMMRNGQMTGNVSEFVDSWEVPNSCNK